MDLLHSENGTYGMKKLAVMATVGICLTTFSAFASNLDGNQLLSYCSYSVKEIDNNFASNIPSLVSKSSACFGFVTAVAQYNSIIISAAKGSKVAKCYSETYQGVTVGQDARVIVKYFKDNPQLLNQWAATLATEALINAFPAPDNCKKLKQLINNVLGRY